MRLAWPNLKQEFSVTEDRDFISTTNKSKRVTIFQGPRYSHTLLQRHPVDLVVIDCGNVQQYATTEERLLEAIRISDRPPCLVIESHKPTAVLHEEGPMGKASRHRWEQLEYNSCCQMIKATNVGGACSQSRLITVRSRRGNPTWQWAAQKCNEFPRSMANQLTPEGLVPYNLWQQSPPPCHRVWTSQDPMPPIWQPWIQQGNKFRKLSCQEMGKGHGGNPDWLYKNKRRFFEQTTSRYHWEYLSLSLTQTFQAPSPPDTQCGFPPEEGFHSKIGSVANHRPEWKWVPPDLTKGGVFYQARLESLQRAASTYEQSSDIIAEGIDILDRHRRNYSFSGTQLTQLQIIWWEFPREHWEPLRIGSSMNFASPPEPGLHPNSPMDEEQQRVASEFVDELLAINAIVPSKPDHPTKTIAPLFCLPKPGQPGQWRIISNMKDGGQNRVVMSDPVYLPRSSHMVTEMYTGGYTAVVDASKFFYQFLTHPNDRQYLGLRHPRTGKIFEYRGLPMGAGNSPALASRYGLAFVRLLRERGAHIFGTCPVVNTWGREFQAPGSYREDLGHGCNNLRKDGKPGVKIWVHVDDFALHGPDYETTLEALEFFMEQAVIVGLLCNPRKCVLPAQVTKYCGFLFDTQHTPTLRIPLAKREHALAMVEFCLEQGPTHKHSRWALAVVVGTLEALVEATPRRLGHTKLRRFHNALRPEGLGTGISPYCTLMVIPEEVFSDLQWWQSFLRIPTGRVARPLKAAILVPVWGDGSGTGTGGTFQVPTTEITMWMAQWPPSIFHHSSNWKELKTLDLSLTQLMHHPNWRRLHGSQVFYFTDNAATYWICQAGSSRSPMLQQLVESIRMKELQLNCFLQVIHVPGTVMIHQGTDNLSRGIWATCLHDLGNPQNINASVLAGLKLNKVALTLWLTKIGLPSTFRMQQCEEPWQAAELLQHFTIWAPPPELARQAISFTLEVWVEAPLTTSALFLVPRVLAGFWHGLSRHIFELGEWLPTDLPLTLQPDLPIPVVVLYLAPFIRQLTPAPVTYSMDMPSTALQHWHQKQADAMRRLPPRVLPN